MTSSATVDDQAPTGVSQSDPDDIIDTSGSQIDDAPDDAALTAGLEDEDEAEGESAPVIADGETAKEDLPAGAKKATADTPDAAPKFWVREGSKFVPYVAPAPVPDPNPAKPWAPDIYGKVEAIFGEGALYKPGVGVLIKEDKIGELRQRIAHATHYPKMQEMRQERATERKTYAERETFQGEKFKDVLQKTLLNPEWMTWAASSNENYATAQMQAQLMLDKAGVEMQTKFGALPAPTEQDARTEQEQELREYGPSAVEAYLNETIQSPEFQGKLTLADRQVVLDHLTKHNVPIFHPTPTGGWEMDERPIKAAMAQLAELRAAGRNGRPNTAGQPVNGSPKPQATARRNAAAVPTPTVPAKAPEKVKPAAGEWTGKPWENPKLSRQEQKDLFYAHYNKVG